jgi:signal peptide peptidase SppA
MNFKDMLPARFRKGYLAVPVVRLAGVISPSTGGLRPGLSLASTAAPLRRAFDFKHSPVVAISVNSPGGSPVQSRLIFQRIRELADSKKKRVLMFVEDVAASGGYMIALAGDEIIADETSIVGSIGVVSAGFGFNEAIRRLGIDRRVYTAGENKVLLDPFQPEKEGDIAYLKSLQSEIHKIFIDMVKEKRGTRLVEDEEIFSGLFWTGARAKELGLIDECGLMGPVLRERYGEQVRLKLVQAKRGLFGRPQPGIAGISGASVAADIGAGIAMSLPAAVDAIEERSLWNRYGL